MIIYIVFLFICFFLGATLFSNDDNIIEFEITCDNGEVERFNISDKYICGGHPNPLRKNIIEIDNFK